MHSSNRNCRSNCNRNRNNSFWSFSSDWICLNCFEAKFTVGSCESRFFVSELCMGNQESHFNWAIKHEITHATHSLTRSTVLYLCICMKSQMVKSLNWFKCIFPLSFRVECQIRMQLVVWCLRKHSKWCSLYAYTCYLCSHVPPPPPSSLILLLRFIYRTYTAIVPITSTGNISPSMMI